MKFRIKAFAVHLLCSAAALSLVLGALYLGWYHWPGWYLSGALHVIAILVFVDVALGPLMTFVIASPGKPRRELKRDIAVIVTVQLAALIYGSTTLWHGRPLYYAFSVNELELVQASDLDPPEAALARNEGRLLAPHWYSLPRWIWAPLPDDPKVGAEILQSAISGGYDVTAMPRYFRPWAQGRAQLRTQLKNIDDLHYFSATEINRLKRRVQAAGIAIDRRDGIALTGRGRPLLAIFDPASLKLLGLFAAT